MSATSVPDAHDSAATPSPTGPPSAAEVSVPPSRSHVPALDGIRGMAALAVMCFHFGRVEVGGTGASLVGAVTQFGWTGVELFFVLSGFLITGVLLDTKEGPDYFRSFYLRRALRILPLYYVFVAAYLFVIAPRLPGPPLDLAGRQGWLWTYLANLDIARHGWYAGAGGHANNLWSLAIEEQFYLVFPLAVFLLPRRGVGAVAVGIVVLSIVSRAVLAHAGYPPRMGYVLTFTRLDGLGFGALLALIARRGDSLDRLAPAARVVLPAALVTVIALAIRNHRFSYGEWSTLQIGLPALTLGYASILLLTVAPAGSRIFRRLFESSILRFLGRYSYSLYIWHPLVGGLLRLAGFSQVHVAEVVHSSTVAMVVTLLGKIAAAIAVSIISYRVIEQPFLRIKDGLPRRRATLAAVQAP